MTSMLGRGVEQVIREHGNAGCTYPLRRFRDIIGNLESVITSVDDNSPPERYGDGYIAYSLGNAAFDQSREATRTGGLLEAVFNSRGIHAIEQHTIRLNADYQPTLVTTKQDRTPLVFSRQEDSS